MYYTRHFTLSHIKSSIMLLLKIANPVSSPNRQITRIFSTVLCLVTGSFKREMEILYHFAGAPYCGTRPGS